MPEFAYTILTPEGRRQRGVLESDSSAAAARRLREDYRARVLSLSENAGGFSTRLAALFRAPPRDTAIESAFDQLGMMLGSGLPLDQALRLLTPDLTPRALREHFTELAALVSGGLSFSGALTKACPKLSPVVLALIEGAEEAGDLPAGLERAAAHLRFRARLRRKLVQSLSYPALVFVLAIAVSVLMVTVFIPRVETFLANSGRSLPPVTRNLFAFTHAARDHGGAFLLGLLLLGIAASLLLRLPRVFRSSEKALFRFPIIGKLLNDSRLTRFAGMMAALLDSGVPVLKCLEVSARASGKSRWFREHLATAREQVSRGKSLRESLRHPLVPASSLGLVAAGEESGQLVRAFQDLERLHGNRLENRISLMVSLLEPAMLLFVGGIVAVVYLALFSAILSLVN